MDKTALMELATIQFQDLVDELDKLTGTELNQLWDRVEDIRIVIEEIWMDRDNPTECENCATPISRDEQGRPRQYCSNACRQSAYRQRQRRVTPESPNLMS